MSVVIDYAWGRPSSASLKAEGASGVARYLSWLPNGKVIDRAEYDGLRAAGLDVVLVWEFNAADFKDYEFKAYDAAQEALRQADALGYTGAIYYALDWDVTAAEWPLVATLLAAGPLTVHGVRRTGIYGPYSALEWAKRDGLANWFWQAGMSTAWSNQWNRLQWPGVHIRQVWQQTIDGVDCDINTIIQSDYGQNGGNLVQITGPDPWDETKDPLAQARYARDGFYGFIDGYETTGTGDNGVLRRLARIEQSISQIKDAFAALARGRMDDTQLTQLAEQVASRLESTETAAVAAALRQVLGGLDGPKSST